MTANNVVLSFVLVSVVAGCSTPAKQLGAWKGSSGDSFMIGLFREDGSCLIAAGGQVDGAGGMCRYRTLGNRIEITDFEKKGGKLERLNVPVEFTYHPESDSISTKFGDSRLHLHRTKLPDNIR